LKQNIKPGVFVAVVVAVVAAAAIACVFVFRTPAAEVARPESGAQAASGASANAKMKADHGGPTADQRQQIQEWKKTHPDAYTRY